MKTVIELAQAAGYPVMTFDGKPYVSPELEKLIAIAQNQKLDEVANRIAAMPFGDTAASFAVWIREQKT
jgi:ABC-type sugar transport system substrate-binding protein